MSATTLAVVLPDGTVKPLSLAEAVEQLFALVGDADTYEVVLDHAEKQAALAAERLKLRSVGGVHVPADDARKGRARKPRAKATASKPVTPGLVELRALQAKARSMGLPSSGSRVSLRERIEAGAAQQTPTSDKPVPQKVEPVAKPAPKRKPASRKPTSAAPIELYVRTHLGKYRKASVAELRRALAVMEAEERKAA